MPFCLDVWLRKHNDAIKKYLIVYIQTTENLIVEIHG